VFLGAFVLDACANRKVLSDDCCVVQNVGRATSKRRMLTDEVQVVQVTANVIPQPIASAIQHDAVLLAIVVVWLVFAPSWF